MNTLAQLIEKIFLLTRMDSVFSSMNGGETKRENLLAFYQLAADFEATSRRELSQFLEHLEALDEKGLMSADEGSTDVVTIMTIHKSKGLEFPVVFLSNLSKEFNKDDLRTPVLCDNELGIGLSVADPSSRIRYPAISKRAIIAKTAAESLSEEMRVLYVAMTRPKDRLIMTYASKSLQSNLQDLALRSGISGTQALTKDANCIGTWVLLGALGRTEAGEFHALGGKPDETAVSNSPWLIRVVEGTRRETADVRTEEVYKALPDDAVEKLRTGLQFRYAHSAATSAPSKMTATQRKGRIKDEEVAVIGGGNSALEEAMYLTQFAKKVYIVIRRDVFRADEIVQQQLAENDKIEVIRKHVPVEVTGENGKVSGLVLKHVETEEKMTLAVKAVFPYIGQDPGTSFVSHLDILDSQRYILTDEHMATKIPGVYAAGDVISKTLRQVVTATSDGAIAAQSVFHYLKG